MMNMTMNTNTLQQRISAGFPEASITVDGDGHHFTALVISTAFHGLSRIKRQQMVYDTVRAELLDGSLHALSVKACTPDEWQAQSAATSGGA